MARYFKTVRHLENYVRKVLRENAHSIDVDNLLPVSMYVDAAFSGQLGDEFGMALRENPTLLEEDRFWKWLQAMKVSAYTISSEIEHIVTKQFVECVSELHRAPGVYTFWNQRDFPLYVGMSVDLANRISSSFVQRFRYYSNEVFLRVLRTDTASDAAVCESVLIARLKPALNGTGKFDDRLTLCVDIPELGPRVPCNVPGEKVDISGEVARSTMPQSAALNCEENQCRTLSWRQTTPW